MNKETPEQIYEEVKTKMLKQGWGDMVSFNKAQEKFMFALAKEFHWQMIRDRTPVEPITHPSQLGDDY